MEKYRVDKILEHALVIEEAGQKFYAMLSDSLDDPGLKKIFLVMSHQEVGHSHVYKKMLDELAAAPAPVSAGGEPFDFKKHDLLEDKIFNRLEIVRKTQKIYTLGDTLALMIDIEINVVDYFENVRRLVCLQDQPKMEQIINEEKTHVRQLVDLRTQYKNTRLKH